MTLYPWVHILSICKYQATVSVMTCCESTRADILNKNFSEDIKLVSVLEIQHVSEAEAFYSLQPKFILDFHMLLRETQAIKPYDAELIASLR